MKRYGFTNRQMLELLCIFVPVAIVALNLAVHSHLGQWTEVMTTPRDGASCESMRTQVATRFPLEQRFSVRAVDPPPDAVRRGVLPSCQIRWAHSLKWPWQKIDEAPNRALFQELNRISEVQTIRSEHRPPLLFWLALLVFSATLVKLRNHQKHPPSPP